MLSRLFAGSVLAAGLAAATTLAVPAPARAGDVATRCGYDGCEAIHCNYTGDRCHHISGDYDGDRYGYARRYGRDHEYRHAGYYRDYDRYRFHTVCDPDGDRCYRSDEPYWNYREYYRRHGYSWNEHHYTDRLNEAELDRSRDYDEDRGYYDRY